MLKASAGIKPKVNVSRTIRSNWTTSETSRPTTTVSRWQAGAQPRGISLARIPAPPIS